MSATTLPAPCSATHTIEITANGSTTILALPRLWLRRINARRALAALHGEQIREAGLDPFALRAESLKPFWHG